MSGNDSGGDSIASVVVAIVLIAIVATMFWVAVLGMMETMP